MSLFLWGTAAPAQNKGYGSKQISGKQLFCKLEIAGMSLWGNVWIARSNLSPVHTNKDGVSVMVWRNSWDRDTGKHLCFRRTCAVGSCVLFFIVWYGSHCVTQSCGTVCTSDHGLLALPPASTLKAALGLSASSQH